MIIEFDGEIFRWDAREDAAWYFTAVPPELSDDIREIPRPYRGFGSVRVRARIGGSEWSTSIFPDSANGSYVLPLKKKVRDAEALVDGGPVSVRLEVLDGENEPHATARAWASEAAVAFWSRGTVSQSLVESCANPELNSVDTS